MRTRNTGGFLITKPMNFAHHSLILRTRMLWNWFKLKIALVWVRGSDGQTSSFWWSGKSFSQTDMRILHNTSEPAHEYWLTLASLIPFLTSAQRSAEVRALQSALYFYLSGVCISALCGLCFTDFRRVAFSCKHRFQLKWCCRQSD